MQSTTQAVASDRGRFSVAAAAGRAWRAAAAAIGTGQAARPERPDPLAALLPFGVPRYLRTPWSAQELARIDRDDRVLVLGTGVAAANVVTALDQQWHRGRVRLVSSTGSLPERLAALRAARRIEVVVGQVEGAASYGDEFVVDILPHGRSLRSSERYDWIVDCT